METERCGLTEELHNKNLRLILTDRVSAEDGVRGHAGQTAASSIDSDDPELVHGTLHQAGDVPVVAQRQCSNRVAVDSGPALGGGLLFLDDVAGDGGAAVILGLVPVDGHGLQADFSHGRLLTLARHGCRWTGWSTIINTSTTGRIYCMYY